MMYRGSLIQPGTSYHGTYPPEDTGDPSLKLELLAASRVAPRFSRPHGNLVRVSGNTMSRTVICLDTVLVVT